MNDVTLHGHPRALALAFLLGPTTDLAQHTEYICGTLDRMFDDFSEEKRADLYAMISEQYDPMAPFITRLALLSRLLKLNETPTCLLF